MAKFKTIMKADKLKAALHKLPPADSTDEVSFHAFRAPVSGEKDSFQVGLYVGSEMKSDYDKDVKSCKPPTAGIFKGTIHRHAKKPEQWMVLAGSGDLGQLKAVGKECLKAAKLQGHLLLTKGTGTADPEPSQEELGEGGTTPQTTPSPQQQQPTPPQQPTQPPPQRPQQQPLPPPTNMPPLPLNPLQMQELKKHVEARIRANSIHVTQAQAVKSGVPAIGQMQQQIEQTKREMAGHVQKGEFAEANDSLSKMDALATRILTHEARQRRNGESSVRMLQSLPTPGESFPSGEAAKLKKEVEKGILKSVSSKFTPVLSALKAVEESAGGNNTKDLETQLANLVQQSQTYLATYKQQYDSLEPKKQALLERDATKQLEVKTCKDALAKVRLVAQQLRVRPGFEAERRELGSPPWDETKERKARQLDANILLAIGGGEQNEHAGFSESYIIKDTSGKEAYVFKPSDGEANPTYGWKKGGGAAREVMLSAINEQFVDSMGINFNVSRTTLAKLEGESLKSPKNGNKPQRTGAMQNFAPSDGGMRNLLKKQDPTFMATVPPEEAQKTMLLDFMTLQMDRQADNFLVQPDGNGTPRLVPIDAGNALPSRKAFEANRRKFTNNAALSLPGADQPFSPEMVQSIDAIDITKVLGGMTEANKKMAAIDPTTKDMVDDENLEMTRRSLLLLKAAAKAHPPLSVKDIASIYAHEFHKVLDEQSPNKLSEAIQAAIRAHRARTADLDELAKLPNAILDFNNLGWGLGDPKNTYTNCLENSPTKLLDIVKNKIENPTVVKEIAALRNTLGNKVPQDLDQKPCLYDRLQELRGLKTVEDDNALLNDVQLNQKAVGHGIKFQTTDAKTGAVKPMAEYAKVNILKNVAEYEKLGGDALLVGKDTTKMSFEEKLFEALGGDAKIEWMKQNGFDPYTKTLDNKLDELQALKEFEGYGGMEEYVKLGGPIGTECALFPMNAFMQQQAMLKDFS